MHIRTPRAAVAANSTPSALDTPLTPVQHNSRPQTLWASRPFVVRAGRLLGVRLVGRNLQVALVENGAGQARWVTADRVLTERQADDWARSATFRKAR